MPISFGCHQCSKQLQARDEFAGRRLKCPGCGTILTIPGSSTAAAPPPPPVFSDELPTPPPMFEAEPPPPPPPPPPPAPTLVKFVCFCGRRMKARIADAGSEVECPDCGKSLVIPLEDSDAPPAAPPIFQDEIPLPPAAEAPTLAPARASFNPWADRSLEQRTAPWKDADTRKRNADGREPRHEKVGGRRWPALLLLLLLIGGGAALWYYWPDIRAKADEYKKLHDRERSEALANDPMLLAAQAKAAYAEYTALDLVPPETLGLSRFTFLRPQVKQKGPQPANQVEYQYLFALPKAPQDVPGRGLKSPVVTLRTLRAPVDLEKLLKQAFVVGHRAEKVNHLTYYVSARQDPEKGPGKFIPLDLPSGLWVVNDHLVVNAQIEVLKQLMALPPTKGRDSLLRDLMSKAGDDDAVIVVDQRQFLVKPLLFADAPIPPEYKDFATALVSVKQGKPTVFQFQLTFADAEKAKAALDAAGQSKQKATDLLDNEVKKIEDLAGQRRRQALLRAVGVLRWQADSSLTPLEMVPLLEIAAEPVVIPEVPQALVLRQKRLAGWTVEPAGDLGLREEHRLSPEFAGSGFNLMNHYSLLATSNARQPRP